MNKFERMLAVLGTIQTHLTENIQLEDWNRRLLYEIVLGTSVFAAKLPSREIVFASPVIERMFGYSSGELDGRDLNILLPLRYEHVHQGHITDYLRQPRTRQMGQLGMELIGSKKDGNEF